MKYFDQLKLSMEYLAKNEKVIFMGQAVEYPGTAMSNTLLDIPDNKKIELPVSEEMQMGMTLGMSMNGFIPVSIFPRWNFLILALNQLINHIDKFNLMYKSNNKLIIRTSIGSKRPLHPQHQHVGDFSEAVSKMCSNIEIIKLNEPEDIFSSYEKAFLRKDSKNTILVEYGDYYNEK